MSIINSIQNLYRVQDLPGEILVQPLKGYQRFFTNKIDQNSGMAKVALRVSYIITGLLIFPLGLVAGVGMLIKLTGIPEVKSENSKAKSSVNVIQTGIQASAGFQHHISTGYERPWLHACVVREFKVTKQNTDTLCSSIQRQIDNFSKQFQKVYLQSNGRIENGVGQIHVILRIYRWV